MRIPHTHVITTLYRINRTKLTFCNNKIDKTHEKAESARKLKIHMKNLKPKNECLAWGL
jgi:hypothetical protein